MKTDHKYSLKTTPYRHPVALILSLSLLLCSSQSIASGGEDPAAPFDEILISVNVQGVGGTQVTAAIRNGSAYLAITEFLDFLKIRNIASAGMDTISGFFIQQQLPYLIDKTHSRIVYKGRTFELPPDVLIHTSTNLYLRTDYFGLVFGLNCKFNFRTLSIIVNTDLELPMVRELRQESMRNNLSRLKGQARVDTSFAASHPFFRLGMADWAVVASQQTQQGLQEQDDNRLNLALGAVLAGGETDVALNYDNQTRFSERLQYYQWRYVNNGNPLLRQTIAGKIFSPSISSIYSPIVGIQFTNTPTIYRRSFGTYTLTYYSEAAWVVELYVNNTLIDYAKAEISGYFTFQVPLVYGNSVVKLKFYSPYGEERSSQQNILIPFNFLPVHELEYTASAGIVEDSLNSRFGRAVVNYGFSKKLTAGAGLEYLSSISSGKAIPFVNASYRINGNLMVAGEYAIGVRGKLLASYHLPSGLQLDLNYIRYKDGQKAINNYYREERKAILSFPIRANKLALFSRLSLYQVILPASKFSNGAKYTTAEGLLAGVLMGVNTSLTTYAIYTDQVRPYVYSNLSMAFRLPGKLILSPQVQYEYGQGRLINMKCELGKFINARGYANLYYENNIRSDFKSAGIQFRYDFSKALAGFSITHGNHSSSMVESASGSILYDDRKKYLAFGNRSNVGRGGILVLPFLDMNANGKRDKGEPSVAGVKLQMNGGRIEYDKSDSSIRVYDLEAYASYVISLDEAFENISWIIRNKTIRILIDPNQMKVVEIPVAIKADLSGMVYLSENDTLRPQERMIVDFYSSDSLLVGHSITEQDGSYNFEGVLPPGSYTARIDPVQLWRLHLLSLTFSVPFTVGKTTFGKPVDGLNITVRHR